jgi:hypothetical protein
VRRLAAQCARVTKSGAHTCLRSPSATVVTLRCAKPEAPASRRSAGQDCHPNCPLSANHSTGSFVFSTGAALCEGRFCSPSSGTRLIGRARLPAHDQFGGERADGTAHRAAVVQRRGGPLSQTQTIPSSCLSRKRAPHDLAGPGHALIEPTDRVCHPKDP